LKVTKRRSLISPIAIPDITKTNTNDLFDTFKTVLANDDPRYMAASESGIAASTRCPPANSRSRRRPPGTGKRRGHPGETMTQQLLLDVSPRKNYLLKNELTNAGDHRRQSLATPDLFYQCRGDQPAGLGKYVRNRGLTYELSPVENSRVDNESPTDHIS